MPVKSKEPSWVDRLVPDPISPPRLQVLSGYRGRAAAEGAVRLYLQADLASWVDLPGDAVVHESESTDALGLPRAWLWLAGDTPLQTGSLAGATGWLGGPIATTLGAESQAHGRRYGAHIEEPLPDPTHGACPTPVLRCQPAPPSGLDPACPTNLCTLAACKTSSGPLCPNPQPPPGGGGFEPYAAAVAPSVLCQPASQTCPPSALSCAPRSLTCPTNFCPTNPHLCPTLSAACNTVLCPTQYATCPPSYGGPSCPTMVCEPYGGR